MLSHQGTKTLETPRLILRRFTIGDAQAMFEGWATDPDVTRFVSWSAHQSISVTRELLTAWEEAYQNDREYNWCIVLRETGTPIGSVGLVRVDDALASADFGYVLAKPYWRRGLAPEAAAAVLDYCFREIGFHRMAAVHHPDNGASGAVMRKLGMQHEGLIREAHMDNQGKYINVEQYAILKREWNGPQRLYAAR